MMLKGFIERTYTCVDYSDMDALLNKHFPNLEISFPADFEMSNDSHKLITVENEPFDEWDQAQYDKLIKGEECTTWAPSRLLMQNLCQQGILPAGEYLVEVCW